MTVFGPGKGSRLHLGYVASHGLKSLRTQIGKLFEEAWVELSGKSQHVIEHQHLAVAARPRTDSDGGNRQFPSDPRRNRLGDEFENNGKRAGRLRGLCVLDEAVLISLDLAHSTERMNRLWLHANVAHDGDIGHRQRP